MTKLLDCFDEPHIRLILEIKPFMQVFLNGSCPSPFPEKRGEGVFHIRFPEDTILKYSLKKWPHNRRRYTTSSAVFIAPLRSIDENAMGIKKDRLHTLRLLFPKVNYDMSVEPCNGSWNEAEEERYDKKKK